MAWSASLQHRPRLMSKCEPWLDAPRGPVLLASAFQGLFAWRPEVGAELRTEPSA